MFPSKQKLSLPLYAYFAASNKLLLNYRKNPIRTNIAAITAGQDPIYPSNSTPQRQALDAIAASESGPSRHNCYDAVNQIGIEGGTRTLGYTW